MVPKKYILTLSMSLLMVAGASSGSANKINIIADGFDERTKGTIKSDLKYLNSYNVPVANKWFDQFFGVNSADGSNVLSFINKNTPIVVNSKYKFYVCDATSGRDINIPECKPENSDRVVSLNEVNRIPFVDNAFGVIDISVSMPVSYSDDQMGFVLTGGESVGIKKDLLLIPYVNTERSVLDQHLGGEAGSIYRLSHYFGAAAFSFSGQLPTSCNLSIGRRFACSTGQGSPFGAIGLMLRDMTAYCATCSHQDRLILLYSSSLYLLSTDDPVLLSIGRKVVNTLSLSFVEIGLDVDYLNVLYRNSLLSH